jgi:hypothetical protein
MGYKTKSMVYAKSLKSNLNQTSEEGDEKGFIDSKASLINTKEKKEGESTKTEKVKTPKKVIDPGVLSGLASGNKGTQTGTAIGIIFNKMLANKVPNTESKAAKIEASNEGSTISSELTSKPEITTNQPVTNQEEFKLNTNTAGSADKPEVKASPVSKKTNTGSTQKVAKKDKVGKPSDSYGIMKSNANKKSEAVSVAKSKYGGPSIGFAKAMKNKSETKPTKTKGITGKGLVEIANIAKNNKAKKLEDKQKTAKTNFVNKFSSHYKALNSVKNYLKNPNEYM